MTGSTTLVVLLAASTGFLPVSDAVRNTKFSQYETTAGTRLGAATGADSSAAVFEGRTPCGATATEFTGFPAENCEKIKWRLTLYRRADGTPTTYVFKGTRSTRQGPWKLERADSNRIVYSLFDSGRKVLSLLSVDDRVLLLLDRDLKVLIGDASWSYALNRTDAR